MINAIIFDFFGVIRSEVAPVWFIKHIKDKQKAITLKNRLFEPFDSGKKSENELFLQLSKISGKKPAIIKKEFDGLATLNDPMLYIIKELNKNYKIGLCSNGGSRFVRSLLKKHSLKKYFDSIIISSEIGITKPAKEIYLKSLEELGVKPKEALFIDDNIKNIKGAQKLGMQTILFQNYDQFVEDLNKLLT